MQNPIASGVSLMVVSFLAFMSLAAIEFEETRIELASAANFDQVQEVKKDTKKTPKICVEKLATQQQAIANKLKEIKKDLNKLRK